MLLVDLRGTGRSGGLFCTELQEDVQGFLDDFLPTEKIRACRDVAFIRDEEIAPAVAGTFLGDFRIRRQKAACEG